MPWSSSVETSEGLVFGTHGQNHSLREIGIQDGVVLNLTHLEKLFDFDFIRNLEEAILMTNDDMEAWIKDWNATNPIRQDPQPSLTTTRAKIWIRDGGICRYCCKQIKLEDAVAEHVFPKSKGGSNRATNLVCACNDCNVKKGARTPKEAGMKMLLLEMKND